MTKMRPSLAEQWHPTKNGVRKPEDYSAFSNKKVWWLCPKGHEWEAAISTRSYSSGNCPVCSNRKLLVGYNDFATLDPRLASEWHPTKNGSKKPNSILGFPQIKVWWLCPHGHEWEATIDNRHRGRGCPFCLGRRIEKGKNDLLTLYPDVAKDWDFERNGTMRPDSIHAHSCKKVWWKCSVCQRKRYISPATRIKHPCHHGIRIPRIPAKRNTDNEIKKINLRTRYPEIADEWHPTKNNALVPEMFTSSSPKRVWWLGKCGHEWEAVIKARTSAHTGCPVCRNQKIISGVNDLATLFPEIADEWHPDKNDISPNEVPPKARRTVWWKCRSCGLEWKAPVYSRVGQKTKCPFCAGKRIVPGNNDLATKHPDLMTEWDYNKNKINPNTLGVSSRIQAWWICKECGHHYQAAIFNRIYEHSGCPKCATEYKVSFSEKAVFYYLKRIFGDACENTVPKDVDFGKMNFDIWIPSNKTGIEYDGWVWHKDPERDKQKNQIAKENGISVIRIRERGCAPIADTSQTIWTNPPRYGRWYDLEEAIEKLLLILHHKVCEGEINIERDKNAIFQLMSFSIKGTSLAARFPHLATEWHPVKNGPLKPTTVSARSGRRVWWICHTCGHEWETSPANRTKPEGGTGCPNCALVSTGRQNAEISMRKNGSFKEWGERTIVGKLLLEEWDYTKNVAEGVSPESIASQTHKKVFWKCPYCGKERFMSPHSRVQSKGYCKCKGRENAYEGWEKLP